MEVIRRITVSSSPQGVGTLSNGGNNLKNTLFLFSFVWCPHMAINNVVSVQYNGGLLPDIVLLTQCYFHRGTRLNAMKRFCICSL